MSLNVAIEDTSFQNEVADGKYRNYPPLFLLYSLMLNLVEGLAIGCYPPFFGSGVYAISELPFISPDLLFGWIASEAFSSLPDNHVIAHLWV